MAKTTGYRIEYMPLEEVQKAPRNPKTHDEPGLDESLEEFGFTEPLVMDENTGKLVAGHGRLEALQRRFDAKKTPPENIQYRKKEKQWLVPVVRGIAFKDAAAAERYLLASNRISEKGGWDDKALVQVLQSLAEMPEGLAGTGFAPADMTALLREVSHAMAGSGPTPEQQFEVFQSAEIKQIVLYFGAEQYDEISKDLDAIRKETGAESNTEAFLKLLKHWKETHAVVDGDAPEAGDEGVGS